MTYELSVFIAAVIHPDEPVAISGGHNELGAAFGALDDITAEMPGPHIPITDLSSNPQYCAQGRIFGAQNQQIGWWNIKHTANTTDHRPANQPGGSR